MNITRLRVRIEAVQFDDDRWYAIDPGDNKVVLKAAGTYSSFFTIEDERQQDQSQDRQIEASDSGTGIDGRSES